MKHKARIIIAVLALCLGAVHIIFGVAVYKTFNLELLWFLSAGVAMMVTALANFRHSADWILRFQNILMFGFIVALAMKAPEPQVWLGLALFGALLAISCRKTPVSL